MVDKLVEESIKISIGKIIIYWDFEGRRFEGKILDCSDEYMKILDTHRGSERFIKLSELREAELK